MGRPGPHGEADSPWRKEQLAGSYTAERDKCGALDLRRSALAVRSAASACPPLTAQARRQGGAPNRSDYFLTGAFFAGRAADLPAVFVVGALDAGAALALFLVGATFVAALAGAGVGGA